MHVALHALECITLSHQHTHTHTSICIWVFSISFPRHVLLNSYCVGNLLNLLVSFTCVTEVVSSQAISNSLMLWAKHKQKTKTTTKIRQTRICLTYSIIDSSLDISCESIDRFLYKCIYKAKLYFYVYVEFIAQARRKWFQCHRLRKRFCESCFDHFLRKVIFMSLTLLFPKLEATFLARLWYWNKSKCDFVWAFLSSPLLWIATCTLVAYITFIVIFSAPPPNLSDNIERLNVSIKGKYLQWNHIAVSTD